MRREVGISIVVIALLIVGGLVLFTSLSRNLSDTQATVTSQAEELDTRATAGTEVANAATGVAEEGAAAATSAASTQSALEGNISDLEATGTQSSDEQAAAETAAAATQSALEDDLVSSQAEATELEDQISDLEATGTQGAEHQSATETAVAATQSALRDEVSGLEATATQAADVQAELEASAAAVQEDFATSQSQVTILEGQATQAAVEQAEIVMAAATAQAASAATLTALQSQAQNPPTEVVQNPTLVPFASPTVPVNVTPIASVQVGSLNAIEEFNPTSGWFVGPVSGAGNAALSNGQYVITVDVVPQSLQSFAQPIVSDGYAEVEAYLTDCTRGGFVGVLMRVQDFGTGGYLFAFACDLSFWAIVVFPTSGQPEVLNSNNLSGVSSASPHTIGVMLDGNFLAMYLNGQLLGSATDNTFSQGMLGLYAESGNAEVVLRFDNFRVWNLP